MANPGEMRKTSHRRGLLTWLTSGALFVQTTTAGIGGALAILLPLDPKYRLSAIVIPAILIMLLHPGLKQLVRPRAASRGESRARFGGPEADEVELASPPFSGNAHAGKMFRTDNAPGEASFLRSFDRLEEILQEALALEIGRIAEEFGLREKVRHLEETGFLTAEDRNDWADALAVRRSMLLAGAGLPAPSRQAVESALAQMLRLQVRLTDRRRILFDSDLMIREQENAALLKIAETID